MFGGSARMLTTSGSRFASTASPWGSASWRYDKTAFLRFCQGASLDTPGPAKREWNGFLALSFADVDADKDGKISAAEFDVLCENVATLPRRFGLAPTWQIEYGGDVAKRTAARKKMFDAIDGMHGPTRGWIGCAQFIHWATTHVSSKVAGAKVTGVDFNHVTDYSKQDFLKAIDNALHDPKSADYQNFYEFLLTIFVEEDHQCKGVVNKEGFARLVDRAAYVPRHFGLAPPSADAARVAELYAAMEDDRLGGVTFRKFLEWTTEHTKAKIEAHKE
jgi:hypothetical protein